MARPLLGDQARTEIIHVRITREQREKLERVFGKAAEGMHAITVAWLQEQK